MIKWPHIDVTMITEPGYAGLTATPNTLTNSSPCGGTPTARLSSDGSDTGVGVEPERLTSRRIRLDITRQCVSGNRNWEYTMDTGWRWSQKDSVGENSWRVARLVRVIRTPRVRDDGAGAE